MPNGILKPNHPIDQTKSTWPNGPNQTKLCTPWRTNSHLPVEDKLINAGCNFKTKSPNQFEQINQTHQTKSTKPNKPHRSNKSNQKNINEPNKPNQLRLFDKTHLNCFTRGSCENVMQKIEKIFYRRDRCTRVSAKRVL